MNRRQMLGLMGTSLGALAGAGLLGRQFLLPPAPGRPLEPVEDLAVRLHRSLDAAQREGACVPFDHPLRQYHNRGVRGGGLPISAATFSREQRSVLTDLLHASLSPQGRERIPRQRYIRWPGVHIMNVLICGEPGSGPWQLILSGAHLMQRLGGPAPEGAAFGGPMIYGDQRGNYVQGLPGNVYRYQLAAGHRLFASLTEAQRRRALLPRAPVQTQIEPRGSREPMSGVAVAALSRESRAAAAGVVKEILSTYHPEEVDYARECLEAHGGVEGLHASWYQDGEVDGSGVYQIFRLEGPAAVFHFRGYPHVHAFVNVTMDGDRPLSVGEILGECPRVLEGEDVRLLFEAAMETQSGADFGFYGAESVAGRLRAGTIRTGDIYTLESWQDRIDLLELEGSEMSGVLLDRLRRKGRAVAPKTIYTVAAAGYTGDRPASRALGRFRRAEEGPLLRDAAIAHIRARGFGAVG